MCSTLASMYNRVTKIFGSCLVLLFVFVGTFLARKEIWGKNLKEGGWVSKRRARRFYANTCTNCTQPRRREGFAAVARTNKLTNNAWNKKKKERNTHTHTHTHTHTPLSWEARYAGTTYISKRMSEQIKPSHTTYTLTHASTANINKRMNEQKK